MNLDLILDVIGFEFRRSLTKGRLAIWAILIAFPVVLFVLVDRQMSYTGHAISMAEWGFRLYILVPEIVVLLSLLLWATPVISTEVEGQTWIYLAMRRSGRSIVLLGKFASAVVWSFSAAVIAISLTMLFTTAIGGFRLWAVLTILSLFSCLAHAGIFVLIGVLVQKRTMVTAAVYTLAVEFGLSLLPALANKLTVNYRLRGLLAEWMEWEEARSTAEAVFGREEPWVHVVSLLAITGVTLFAAVFFLKRAQYPTQQDG